MRLARRRRSSDQHRIARRAARAHPRQLRRASHGYRARADACAGGAATEKLIALKALWLVGDGPQAQANPSPHAPFPAPEEGIAAASGRSRRHVRHPLHFGHDRPLQGRVLPARPVFLVGGLYRRALGRARRRRADDDAAAVPHQRAQQLLSGDAERRDARSSSRAFPPPASCRRWRGTACDDHLCARRHGADAAGAAAGHGRPRPQGAGGVRSGRAGAFPSRNSPTASVSA